MKFGTISYLQSQEHAIEHILSPNFSRNKLTSYSILTFSGYLWLHCTPAQTDKPRQILIPNKQYANGSRIVKTSTAKSVESGRNPMNRWSVQIDQCSLTCQDGIRILRCMLQINSDFQLAQCCQDIVAEFVAKQSSQLLRDLLILSWEILSFDLKFGTAKLFVSD